MDQTFIIPKKFKIATFALMGLGVIAFIYAFLSHPERAWANLLINNYYFIALAIGATFFGALQFITQSGWSSGFVRIHQGIANFFPVLAILMIPLLFGMHSLYHWSHHDAVAHDAILQHKAPYLNVPFFIIRFFIYFIVWIGMTQLLRKLSFKEDLEGGIKYFEKSEFYSKVYIFSLALTFSAATFDWIMSIDAHWFSTIFALRNFAMGFYHAVVLITLIVIILNKMGYLPFLTKYHLKDLSKYIFILSIIWAYTWFSQYILIWYANIPEETVYYIPRTQGEFTPLFYGEFFINWLFPFLALMSGKVATNKNALLVITTILLIGQYVDIYMQVTVGTLHHLNIGFIEIAGFLGFVGLFAYVFAWSLSKKPLVAKNHPLLNECTEHHD
jgi:hypothetical protein